MADARIRASRRVQRLQDIVVRASSFIAKQDRVEMRRFIQKIPYARIPWRSEGETLAGPKTADHMIQRDPGLKKKPITEPDEASGVSGLHAVSPVSPTMFSRPRRSPLPGFAAKASAETQTVADVGFVPTVKLQPVPKCQPSLGR